MQSTLKGRAYKHIREKLLTGAMPPGSRVSEMDLAREIGMSRTPVREALVVLESEGLLQHQPGEGVTVMRLSRRDLQEAFEVRELLECGAVALAATRLTEAELASLDQILRQYEKLAREIRDSGSLDAESPVTLQMTVLDMAFHMNVISGTKNRRLIKMVGDIHVLTRTLGRWASLPSVPALRRLALIIRGHRRILRSLKQRESAAAQHWMREHVTVSRDYHLAAFDWEERQALAAAHERREQSFPKSIMQLLDQMESGQLDPHDP